MFVPAACAAGGAARFFQLTTDKDVLEGLFHSICKIWVDYIVIKGGTPKELSVGKISDSSPSAGRDGASCGKLYSSDGVGHLLER